MRKITSTILAVALLLGATPFAMATLIGTNVTIDTFQDGGFREGATVVPDGTPAPEVFIAPFFDYNIENDFIDLNCVQGVFCNTGSNGFTYEVVFSGLDWGGLGSLLDAFIDPITDCVSCNASISGINASGFSLDFGPDGGWSVDPNDFIRIGLVSSHVDVPEPTTLSLLGAALIGIGLTRRRRRP